VSGFCAVPRITGLSGVKRAFAVGLDPLVVDHRAEIVIGQQFRSVDLVRGAESVEEVNERHARFSVEACAIRRSRALPGPTPRHSMAKPVWRQAITSL
jgi:hypothetical protein